MIHLLLLTHGQFADGILDAANLIVGKQSGVEVLALKEGDSIDEFSEQVLNVVNTLKIGCEGVLIMVDVFGASPCNVVSSLIEHDQKIDVVSGLNLPMLLEVLLQRKNLSLSELAQAAAESGREGIKIISNLLT